MKLVDLIAYLVEPEKLRQLCHAQSLAQEALEDDTLCIFMEEALQLDSRVRLVTPQECGGRMHFRQAGVAYVFMLEVDLAVELLDQIKEQVPSPLDQARRLLQCAVYGV